MAPVDIEAILASRSPPDPAILARLTDAHCHPIDSWAQGEPEPAVTTGTLCVMSTTLANQSICEAYSQLPSPPEVVPFFGLHPWFMHHLSLLPASRVPSKIDHYTSLFPASDDEPGTPHPALEAMFDDLPDPVPLESFIGEMRSNLKRNPRSMVGELGLDRSFRLHYPLHTLREGEKRSSPLATPISHQLAVVEAQLALAVELGRNVSFHSVRAQGETLDLLKRMKEKHGEGWDKVWVCLHSFGGSAEVAKVIQKNHPNVFFSFSIVVSSRSPKFPLLLAAISPTRILLESDVHMASLIDEHMWDIFRVLCAVRGWTEDDAVHTLESNWRVFRDERPTGKKKSRRQEKRERKEWERREFESSSESGDDEAAKEPGARDG